MKKPFYEQSSQAIRFLIQGKIQLQHNTKRNKRVIPIVG